MKLRTITAVAVGTLLLTTSLAVAPSQAEPVPAEPSPEVPVLRPATDTFIVTFDAKQANIKAAAADAVDEAVDEVAQADVVKVVPITDDTAAVTFDEKIPRSDQADLTALVEALPGVKAAEPEGIAQPTTTDDTLYPLLWNVSSGDPWGTSAEDAWTVSRGAGVVVGVLDTGITPHPDLTGSETDIVGGNVVTGYDMLTSTSRSGDGDGRDPDPTDAGDWCTSTGANSSWHGDHVAGTVAALAGNGIGVAGVAPEAKVQPIRVLGHCGGPESDIIAGIRWAAGLPVSGIATLNKTPVNIINMSLGNVGRCSTAMQSAIDAAYNKGVLVVAGAGNNNSDLDNFQPANCNHVVRVTATGAQGELARYSNHGTATTPATISAPGGNNRPLVWSTINAGTTTATTPSYGMMRGTSMATPHVAAVAALLKSHNPSLTPDQLVAAMTSTATPITDPDCSIDACGAGIVNAASALGVTPGSANSQEQISALNAMSDPSVEGVPELGFTCWIGTTYGGDWTRTYQWLRDNSPIPGATEGRYTITQADLGTSLRVAMTVAGSRESRTFTSPAFAIPAPVQVTPTASPVQSATTSPTPAPVQSATTSPTPVPTPSVAPTPAKPVLKTLVKRSSPKISGTFKKGKTLEASPGTWSVKVKVSYQWLRSGSKIKNATKSSYKLTKADKKKKVSVRITVSAAGYLTATATTSAKTVK